MKNTNQQIRELKKQIEDLKKEKLLKVLLELYKKKQILSPKPNPLSKYRSVYITYLKYHKRYPNDTLPIKYLWQEKEFKEKVKSLTKNKKAL